LLLLLWPRDCGKSSLCMTAAAFLAAKEMTAPYLVSYLVLVAVGPSRYVLGLQLACGLECTMTIADECA